MNSHPDQNSEREAPRAGAAGHLQPIHEVITSLLRLDAVEDRRNDSTAGCSYYLFTKHPTSNLKCEAKTLTQQSVTPKNTNLSN